MRAPRRIGIALLTVSLAAASGVGWADNSQQQSAKPPGAGLLEFLGSVDPAADSNQPADGSWLAYLSQIDIGKVAKASQPPSQAPAQSKAAGGNPPAAADKPGASGVQNDD